MLPFASERFHQLWTAEAVRLTEEREGRQGDARANAQARERGGGLQQRILTRAALRAPALGLGPGPGSLRWAAIAMALLAVLAGAAAARASLGDGSQPVNLLVAWFVLLGWQLLTLLFWLLFTWPRRGAASGGWLGEAWLALAQRWTRQGRASVQLQAGQALLRQQGLSRYALGMAVHLLWLLALGAAWVTVTGLTTVRRYEFVWETTLLNPEQVMLIVQALGYWPGLLGLSLPDAQVVQATGAAQALSPQAQQQWAWWLIGSVVAYGLLPRLACLLGCLWAWHSGQRHLTLDLSEPGYHVLLPELMPAHRALGVVDPDPGTDAPQRPGSSMSGQGVVVAGLELSPELPWPPPLPAGVRDAGRIDDGAQRRALVRQLAEGPPARLLVVCDPARSPDRGALGYLSELAGVSGELRVWLPTSGPSTAAQDARRADWLASLQARGLRTAADWPASWLAAQVEDAPPESGQ